MLTALARWCVLRRNYVIVGWVALIVALGGAIGAAGNAFSDATSVPSSDSATAYALLGDAGNTAASSTGGTVVWHVESGSALTGSARERLAPALAAIAKVGGVSAVVSPFSSIGAGHVSEDGRTAYASVTFDHTAHADQAAALVKDAATAGLTVQTGGKAFTDNAPSETGEIIGVLAALLVLLLVFRSAWAAALPIITGVAGVGLSTLVVMLLSHLVTMSSFALSMSALIGLGVGIDYALFIVNRQRKALRSGADVAAATSTALNTSGRAVLFAGATVIVALLGMLVLGVGFLTGMAVAAAVTVALTVVAAVTLLPALLAKVGLRVLPRRERRVLSAGGLVSAENTAPTNGFWVRWSNVVERRPAAVAVGASVVLVALAAPVVALRLGTADASSDRPGSVTRNYDDTMAASFGAGFESQLLVVARTPDATASAAWSSFVTEASRIDGVASVTPSVNVGGPTLSLVSITPTTAGQDRATADLVSTLRSDAVTTEAGTGLAIHVGGATATGVDFADSLTSKLPIFLVIIGVLGFLLLMIAFRSLLIPALGALGNLLSIGVALGATVALFQWGWGPAVFSIGGGAPVEPVVAMLIVGVMFGLAMDYHVFLVSRMHEEWTRSGDHRLAIRAGVADTGRVIATAATIMGLVFVSFGFAGLRTASEFGVGLAVAVLADALLVRMTIIPALMHLLGRRSWALPTVLDRVLPHLSVEGGEHDDDLTRENPRPQLVGSDV